MASFRRQSQEVDVFSSANTFLEVFSVEPAEWSTSMISVKTVEYAVFKGL